MAMSEVATFFADVYRAVLDLLSVSSAWLKWLVSPQALLWYALGLLTLPILQHVRMRFAFWRMKRRLIRQVQSPNPLIPAAMSILSRAYPKAPIEIRKEEIENILGVLRRLVEIGGRNPAANQKRSWSEVESSWLEHFVSKCRMIQEPPLQEAMAKAFLREATKPGQLGHREIDALATLSIRDWRTFTAICSCACQMSGRITPVVLNFEDGVYNDLGLQHQALDSLIAAGLVTSGGAGDTYTLGIPNEGIRVKYFDEEEFVVSPLSGPIERSYLGRKNVQPHPLDKSLNVGVVDFTQLGRILGFLTPCSKIDGFTEYLRRQWQEYLGNVKSSC